MTQVNEASSSSMERVIEGTQVTLSAGEAAWHEILPLLPSRGKNVRPLKTLSPRITDILYEAAVTCSKRSFDKALVMAAEVWAGLCVKRFQL